MTGGWRAQLDRVRRWHARLATARNPSDRHDFLYAFFESAFHLRDWLLDAGAASERDIRTLFEGAEEMRLCRDLANSHKHFSLYDPSQPLPPSEALEFAAGFGNLDTDTSLVVLSDGKKHDAFELATKVLRSWEAFILSHVKP